MMAIGKSVLRIQLAHTLPELRWRDEEPKYPPGSEFKRAK